MNLETLKKRNAANVMPVTLDDGQVVHLRKLTATDGLTVGKSLMALGHTDPNGAEPTQEQYFDLYVLLLSKTIVEQQGESWVLSLDSDEGRAALRDLKFSDAHFLSQKAQEWSGLMPDESKKN